MTTASTRQQIYDRIKASSRDEVILEEMQRLGFWELEKPVLPEALLQQEELLTKELSGLLKKERRHNSQEALLKDMHRARKKAAKQKREDTKQRHKETRALKAQYWKQQQENDIIYLGKGVSGGLNNTVNNVALLMQYQLPVIESVKELAHQLNISLSDMRYLLFQRKVDKRHHYYTFEIAKKSGGKRTIAAPKKSLKKIQYWLLENILSKPPVNKEVHGFVKQRSVVTNANPHTGMDVVINLDLKDFFPSIHYGRVKGLFKQLGYSEQLATIFSLICTRAEVEKVAMDGVDYFVQRGERVLPQGSPASPAISNLIAFRLDKKLIGLAHKYGYVYTRYADDLTFSCKMAEKGQFPKLLYFIKKIIVAEGFRIHPEKTLIMRKGMQQKVTGIIVNRQLNVPREKIHRLRAILHSLEKNGWDGQKEQQRAYTPEMISGYIHFIKMVNPQKAAVFQQKLDVVIAKYGFPVQHNKIIQHMPIEGKKPQQQAPLQAENDTIKKDDWWNIF